MMFGEGYNYKAPHYAVFLFKGTATTYSTNCSASTPHSYNPLTNNITMLQAYCKGTLFSKPA